MIYKFVDERLCYIPTILLACLLDISISSHFEHLHYSILQEANIVVDQNSLVNSTPFAHQADQ
jgi:hypothetical protein